MFKELKSKTDEVLNTRYLIAFIVMIISLGVSLIFLVPMMLMLVSGHDWESYWQLAIIIPTFCIFLLALFYAIIINKERKRRIEEDPEKTIKSYSLSWLKITIAAISSVAIIVIAVMFLGLFSLIILAILIMINLLIFYPELKEKIISSDS